MIIAIAFRSDSRRAGRSKAVSCLFQSLPYAAERNIQIRFHPKSIIGRFSVNTRHCDPTPRMHLLSA
jgi:hypothetical protein